FRKIYSDRFFIFFGLRLPGINLFLQIIWSYPIIGSQNIIQGTVMLDRSWIINHQMLMICDSFKFIGPAIQIHYIGLVFFIMRMIDAIQAIESVNNIVST